MSGVPGAARIAVERIAIPAALDDSPEADLFRDAIAVRNASSVESYGSTDDVVDVESLHSAWSRPREPKQMWVARLDGRVVARGTAQWGESGEAETVEIQSIDVHPDARRLGVGRALAEALEAEARAHGRARILVWTASRDVPGPRLESPTGSGSVPAAHPDVRFAVERGFRLEQVIRMSAVDLDRIGDAEARLREVADGPAAGYRLHAWGDRTPDEWLDEVTVLHTRMSTDAPDGGLDVPEDTWDADRVRSTEENDAAGPVRRIVSAVEHVESGRLAGWTELQVFPEGGLVHQGDTLVLTEHRGHRLGMLLKLANLVELARRHPDRRRVLTWNAEENRPMLDVNDALGFEPLLYEGAWRKDLV